MIFRTKRQGHRAAGIARIAAALAVVAVAAAVALGARVCRAEEVAAKTLPLGEKAPLFVTSTIGGQPFDLGAVASKKGVVLFFWSLFCSPCREEMPLIEKLWQDLKEQPVEIVGVNLDEPPLHNAVKNFLKGAGYTYTIIVNKTPNADSQSDKLYQITGTPAIYLIKTDGTIAFAHVGRMEIEDLRKTIQEKLLTPNM